MEGGVRMIPHKTMDAVEKRLNEYRRAGKTVVDADSFSDIPDYMAALGQFAVYGDIDWSEDITGLKVRITGD